MSGIPSYLMPNDVQPVLVGLELENIYVSALIKVPKVLWAIDSVIVTQALKVPAVLRLKP